MNRKSILLAAVLLLTATAAHAQYEPPFGTSTPSKPIIVDPQFEQVQNPCPEVPIKQKNPNSQYRNLGWDTIMPCNSMLILSTMPYIPVERFNGQYTVDEIDYNPPDPTFTFGTILNVPSDDWFAVNHTHLDYTFYFFGKPYTDFVMGANGLISFGTAAENTHCAFSYSANLPWPDGKDGIPGDMPRMRNAIYGVFEDTDPGATSSNPNHHPDWGIRYGVMDAEPCRKIIGSWNEVQQFSCSQKICSYQIVCYEGTNIIEVHVKKRNYCSSWNGGHGIIGIQNENGQPQVRSTNPEDANSHAWIQGAPPAFFPANRNTFEQDIFEEAWRFTPQGTRTVGEYGWYRIISPGVNDTMKHDASQENYYDEKFQYQQTGYDWETSDCPTLTKAYIKNLTEPTQFAFFMKIRNVAGYVYDLQDTITVGVLGHDADLHAKDSVPTQHVYHICDNDTARITLEYPKLQQDTALAWYMYRIADGDTSAPWTPSTVDRLLHVGNIVTGSEKKSRTITFIADSVPDAPVNKVDTIRLRLRTYFAHGCDSITELLVVIHPTYDITVDTSVCRGDPFYWDATGTTYYEGTDPAVDTILKATTFAQCDSIMRLHLRVLNDTVIVIDTVDCQPITWEDSTFYESTVYSKEFVNAAGCKSVERLNFQYRPVVARIKSDIESYTYDRTTAELTDISLNNNRRTWIFPDDNTHEGVYAFYTIPLEEDSAKITLVAYSPYAGACVDTTYKVIPFNKENIWLPNIFNPEDNTGNNLFGAVTQNLLSEEMYIYNRRGELVYQCNEVGCMWDGRDLKGNACPQGAYVYVIRYTDKFQTDRTKVKKGTITLVR